MLKQVGSVVVAGLVGAMSFSAQGENPNPMIPIVLAGGAFLGASVLFNKLEPDLSVPVVAAPSSTTSQSSNTYESGKKKGKKAVVKKEEKKAAPAPAPVVDAVSDEEVADVVSDDEPVVKKADKKKKKSGGGKKEEKKVVAAAVASVAEKKAVKETPKKAPVVKKEEKKAPAPAPVPAPVVAKKDEKKKDKKAAAAAAPVAAKKDDKKAAAAGDKKKKSGKKEEKKAAPVPVPVVSASEDDADDEDSTWTVVKKKVIKPKEPKEGSNSNDSEKKDNNGEAPKAGKKPLESTIKINPEKFGIIIGPGGATLQLLQSKTGTKIRMPRLEEKSNVIQVSGTAEEIKNAKDALKQLEEQGWSRATHAGWEDADFRYKREKDIGLIIGKDGANIKKFQEEFKVLINTPKPGSSDMKVQINGERDNVRACKKALTELLDLGYSPIVYPDFITLGIRVTRKELMAVMGTRGSNIKHIQKQTGIHGINVPRDDNKDGDLVVTLIGYPAQVAKAEAMVRAFLAPEEPAAPEPEWGHEETNVNEAELWN